MVLVSESAHAEGRTFRATAAKYGAFNWGGDTEAAPRGSMRTLTHQDVLDHAVQVITLARPVVEAVTRRDRELGSQLRRAMSSVALNIAEGFGTEAGNARLRFQTARGSLYEARVGILVAAAWGYISADEARPLLDLVNSLGGRVYGLARR